MNIMMRVKTEAEYDVQVKDRVEYDVQVKDRVEFFLDLSPSSIHPY
jgi:hypothetical protein